MSALQASILDILTRKRLIYYPNGHMSTPELLEELVDRNFYPLLPENGGRKKALYSIRRACETLQDRGLISGSPVPDSLHPWVMTIEWALTDEDLTYPSGSAS
jgi:hypothetical protein